MFEQAIVERAKEAEEEDARKKIRLLSINIFMRPPFIKNNKSDHKDARLLDVL